LNNFNLSPISSLLLLQSSLTVGLRSAFISVASLFWIFGLAKRGQAWLGSKIQNQLSSQLLKVSYQFLYID
jgi:hypothetical protein